jgi:tRNA threonylcarbamoyladenosine biosynthesis protein TsaE
MISMQGVFAQVTEDELQSVATEIVGNLEAVKVWLFHGDLGSGKTTLIKVIGEQLGVKDAMSSPSFSVVNEYHAKRYDRIYHFDFYRIKTEVEAFDIGVEEYFYSGYPCFIEWPERVPSLVPATYGEVTITIENEKQRTIAISVHAG